MMWALWFLAYAATAALAFRLLLNDWRARFRGRVTNGDAAFMAVMAAIPVAGLGAALFVTAISAGERSRWGSRQNKWLSR